MERFDLDRGLRLSRTVSPARLMVAAVLAGAALAGAGCGKEEPPPPAPVAMVVGAENLATAEVAPLVSGPLLSGVLAARQQANVRAEIPATVRETLAQEGQSVARGALLARLDAASLRDAALSARAGVRASQDERAWAEREAERAATLLQAGAVAPRVAEEAATRRAGADARLSDARARLALADEQLSKAVVRAPFAGIVARRAVSAGDTVMPGSELFVIVDPAVLQLEATVAAEQLAALRVGMPVTFEVRGGAGRKFEGAIERIAPVADPLTRQVAVFVTVPNPGADLVSGLYAEGRVSTAAVQALSLPLEAVDRELGAPAVLKIVDGAVARVDVELGIEDREAERVEIRSGVAAGDQVLIGAARRLTPGTRVEIRAAPEPAAPTPADAVPAPTPSS